MLLEPVYLLVQVARNPGGSRRDGTIGTDEGSSRLELGERSQGLARLKAQQHIGPGAADEA